MSCIVQVGEYTVLSLEDATTVTVRFDIIRIPIDCIGTGQISDLCYAKFVVTNLLVQKTWFHFS